MYAHPEVKSLACQAGENSYQFMGKLNRFNLIGVHSDGNKILTVLASRPAGCQCHTRVTARAVKVVKEFERSPEFNRIAI